MRIESAPPPASNGMGRSGRRRPLRTGIRVRSALAAAAVVTVALFAGAGILVYLLQRSLLASAENAARTQAAQVADQLTGGDSLGGLSAELADMVAPGQVVQVLDARGRVVAASVPHANSVPLDDRMPSPGQVFVRPVSRLQALHPDGGYLIFSRGVAWRRSHYVVIVAVSVVAEEETVSRVGVFLLVGSPIMALIAACATFVFVGRSLGPVERIRRQVEVIGAGPLTERVPVPDTGDEVARLGETMNRMLNRLQLSQETQRRFVADASHELRSPLATLRATLDVSAAEGAQQDWGEHWVTLDAETDRMRHLVDDLLLLAKVDEQGLQLVLTDVDLDDLVVEEVRRLRAMTELTVEPHLQVARCTGDPMRLAQLLRNLTDNAVRHTRSRIGFRVSVDGLDAVVAVDDDGPGIAEAERSRVFERFVRLDASRGRRQGGAGLGLAIAAEIVAGHHGSIAVSTSPWGGARVAFRLPLTVMPNAASPPSSQNSLRNHG